MKFTYEVPDFEHQGDFSYAQREILDVCPEATDFSYTQERDYEAESDYTSEYGELDEYIYKGIIKFDAPAGYYAQLKDFGCY